MLEKSPFESIESKSEAERLVPNPLEVNAEDKLFKPKDLAELAFSCEFIEEVAAKGFTFVELFKELAEFSETERLADFAEAE